MRIKNAIKNAFVYFSLSLPQFSPSFIAQSTRASEQNRETRGPTTSHSRRLHEKVSQKKKNNSNSEHQTASDRIATKSLPISQIFIRTTPNTKMKC
jgi:hypothetical protein